MPLYMDLHKTGETVTADHVAQGHLRELEVQHKHDVKFLTYWFNEAVGKIFCLLEAPNVNAVVAVLREAHNLVPDEIIEVEAGKVEGFLGDVEDTTAARDPSKPVHDSAFRTILFTDMEGSTAMTHSRGDEGAMDLLRAHNSIIASFTSITSALEYAIAIQRGVADHSTQHPDARIGVRIGLSAGEPVEEHSDLFGAAVQLAARICEQAGPGQILTSNVIKELTIGNDFSFEDRGEVELKGFPGPSRVHESSGAKCRD